jgi:hypothetical protein
VKSETRAVVLLFTLLTAAMTWPQVLRLGDGVNDVGDPMLNTWALAWIAHQLPFAPAHVFDGNIFHPERRTLAFSETLLAPGLMGAPMLWLGAGPVFVYNLLLFFAFVFSGVFTVWLVRDLTGSRAAGVVAGAIFAFLPFKFDHYAHFQLLQTQWMPLALWAFHRVLRDGRLGDGLLLGLAVACQALSSMYNGLFLVSFIGVVGGTLLLAQGASAGRRIGVLLAGAGLAAVLVAPAAIAHSRASEVVGERSRDEARMGSAEWQHFLSPAPSSVLYRSWERRFGAPERRLFPGLLAAGLSVVALWPPWSWTRVAYALGLLFAVDMSRGVNGWLYGFFYDYLFVFRSLRVPARMGVMVGFALAVLAGFGLARIGSRLGARWARAALAGVALAVVLAESRVAPMRLATVPVEPPEIYADLLGDKGDPPRATIIRRLSDPPRATIVELPMAREDPTFMYYATFHWQVLVNGYSGFFAPGYLDRAHVLNALPSADGVRLLTQLQVRYVVVHGELLRVGDHQRLLEALDAHAPEFTLISRRPWKDSTISLYRFVPRL